MTFLRPIIILISMKRIIVLLLTIITVVVFTMAFAACDGGTLSYFNSFSSSEAFSSLKTVAVLPDDVTISTRFSSDYYSIKKPIENSTLYSYGLLGKTSIVIEPSISSTSEYHSYDFADVSEKFAVAVKSATSSGSVTTAMGAYALATTSDGEEVALDVVPFIYYVPTTTQNGLQVVDESSMPVKIVGDYICLLQDIDTPVKTDSVLKGAVYHTFYSYDEDGLRPAFKVSGSSYLTRYEVYDDYLVRYDDYSKTYGAYLTIHYYKISDVESGSELTPVATYSPYNESEITSLLSSVSSSASKNVEVATYYLGNGAFLRKRAVFCSERFENYNLRITSQESPFGYNSYVSMESDRISIRGSFIRYNNANVFPYEVVNQYNDAEMRYLADYYNNNLPVTSEELGDNLIYQYPYYSTASTVADNYSIVYTYWQPYLDSPGLSDDDKKLATLSFIIYDNTDLSKKIVVEDATMPVVNVDGIGLETYSLDFSDVLVIDAVVHGKNGKTTVAAGVNVTLPDDSTVRERYVYKSYLYHDGFLIAGESNLLIDAVTGYKKGAYKYVGGSFKQVVGFEYDELTPFFGGYATAAKWDVTAGRAYYYRLDSSGKASPMSDNVYALHNGCYVTRVLKDGKDDEYVYALFPNTDGAAPLIDYCADSIAVYEEFLTDGGFVKTTVIKRVDNHDEIYILQ